MASFDSRLVLVLPPGSATKDVRLVREVNSSKEEKPNECFLDLASLSVYMESQLKNYQCHDKAKCRICGHLGKLPVCEVTVESETERGMVLDSPSGDSVSSGESVLITVSLAEHYKGSIDFCAVSIQVYVWGRPMDAALGAIVSVVPRLQLSSIPAGIEAFLSNLKILKLKDMTFARGEWDSILSYLSRDSSQLEVLEMHACIFDGLVVDPLFDALALCTTLLNVSLVDCDFSSVSPSDIQDYVGCDTNGSMLAELTVRECVLGDETKNALCRLLCRSKQLRELRLTGNEWPIDTTVQIAKSLVGVSTLHSLDLSGFDGDQDAVAAIATLLESDDSHIERLTLTGNPQPLQVAPIAGALAKNSSLMDLNVSANEVQGLAVLIPALQNNSTLKSLNISQITFGDDIVGEDGTVQSIIMGIGNANLQFLDISRIRLSQEMLDTFAQGLQKNTKLQTLYANHIEVDEGVKLENLINALKGHPSLTSLELGQNLFDMPTMNTLVSTLVKNTTLKSLTLSGCNLTDDLVALFAARLPEMRGLQDLDLNFNQFGAMGAQALREGMKENKSVSSLTICNSCWSVGGPTHFECNGYEAENEELQLLVQRNKNAQIE